MARETAYYLDNIKNVKSIDDFLADDRVFAYAMKAFGLQDMTYAKAFMRKVLTEGIADSDSFANKLADKRYREFADTFNFAEFGTTTTIFDVTRQGTVDRYVRQTLEEDAGGKDEGVRLALYFERKAADLTSPFSILADAGPPQSCADRAQFAGNDVSPGHRQAGRADLGPPRHRGSEGSGQARQVPQALHHPVGDRQSRHPGPPARQS